MSWGEGKNVLFFVPFLPFLSLSFSFPSLPPLSRTSFLPSHFFPSSVLDENISTWLCVDGNNSLEKSWFWRKEANNCGRNIQRQNGIKTHKETWSYLDWDGEKEKVCGAAWLAGWLWWWTDVKRAYKHIFQLLLFSKKKQKQNKKTKTSYFCKDHERRVVKI